MSNTKLPAGPRKVILTDHDAIRENALRARAGGRIFVPPFVALVLDDEGRITEEHRGHSFTARSVTGKSAVARLPFDVPRDLEEARMWLETRAAVELEPSA